MNTPALILAAGKGSRMGFPKALMMCADRPWWEIQTARLREAGITSRWVVSPQVLARLDSRDIRPADLVQSDSSLPMFASVRTGIDSFRSSPPDGLFILPIDVPASRQGDLWRSLRGSPAPVAPLFQGKKGHPIYLPWVWITSTFDPAVAAAPNPDKLRLDELLRPSLLEIAVNDPVVACNLNTPDDLQRFLESPAFGPSA